MKGMRILLAKYASIALFFLFSTSLAQQSQDVLFSDAALKVTNPSELMTLRLEIPIKTLRKETNDSTP